MTRAGDGPRLLVRADADATIGFGHAMRCLALVQALADTAGGSATFAMHDPPPAFAARAAAEGAAVLALGAAPGGDADRDATLAAARAAGADWIVLDGYRFGGAYEAGIVAAGARVLAVDDHAHGAARHDAHVVLDQNLGATTGTYTGSGERTQLLLGPRYALLRREFGVARRTPTTAPAPERACHVLVGFGGSDPTDASTRVLDALAHLAGPFEIEVLVGAGNPHGASLAAAAARAPHRVVLTRDAADVAARMARADLAVAAAGVTAWELACCGTPQVTLATVPNQAPVAAALAAAGIAVAADGTAAAAAVIERLAADRDERRQLSERGRALVDGHGAARVLAAMGLHPTAGPSATLAGMRGVGTCG